MPLIAVSALGADRPGIVAAITRVLVAHRLNIADAQCGILSGRFSMMLIVEAPDELDRGVLMRDLERAGGDVGLDAIHAHDVTDSDERAPVPTHMVTVYGVDHPGIVHAVAATFAERAIGITDLNTRRVTGDGGEPLYVMMLEVAAPELGEAELAGLLAGVAERQDVEVTVREIDDDAL